MADRTVLITGSTDGIGRATALQLAQRGFHVILHGRSREKGRKVMDEIRNKSGNQNIRFFLADLASQNQVRNLAAEIEDNFDQLHVLVNNAGTYQADHKLTKDGIEITLAVNYLAPFLLTHELLDLMKKSAPSRIINVASATHRSANLDWGNLQKERYYDAYGAYATSKLAVILFTYALARRLADTNVTVNCLHPGVVKTKLLRAGFGDIPGDTPEKGACTSVYLANSAKLEGISGQYFEDCKPRQSSPITYDENVQEQLWHLSEKLTGLG